MYNRRLSALSFVSMKRYPQKSKTLERDDAPWDFANLGDAILLHSRLHFKWPITIFFLLSLNVNSIHLSHIIFK